MDEWHGTNAFLRDGERVFRTYLVERRGDEALGGTWSYLDLTALGARVMTLLHLERFHFGAANGGIARFAAWVFLAVYVFVPTVGTWLCWREQRLAGPPPGGRLALPGWFKLAAGAQGGLLVAAIATGGYVLAATAGGTAERRPATIR